MTRTHRRIHRVLWPALALAVALGFTLALVLRPPPEAQPVGRNSEAYSAMASSDRFGAIRWRYAPAIAPYATSEAPAIEQTK